MIETDRLLLRPWTAADKPACEAILNTAPMMEFFGGVAPSGTIDALVDSQIAAQAKDGVSMWAVIWKADGSLAGMCGLRKSRIYSGTPIDEELETGWRIGERFWGKGVAREAAAASIAWGFANRADPRVSAWTCIENVKSWRLMERLGMTRRADLDFAYPLSRPGAPHSAMIVYAIDRPA